MFKSSFKETTFPYDPSFFFFKKCSLSALSFRPTNYLNSKANPYQKLSLLLHCLSLKIVNANANAKG
jgi:hypothetical protein